MAVHKAPVPNIRDKPTDEMELELAAAFGTLSLEDALEPASNVATKEIEPDARRTGLVLGIHEDDVFVGLGGRDQGVLSARVLPAPPEVGQSIEVMVRSFDAEEGLYRLTLPGGAVDVGDWSTVHEGMVVEARVTGHNKGGLECEVNHLRGFIPAGQVAEYRVEDLSTMVGEKLVCLITDANPDKRNLVLSRRALVEQERAESREKLLAELEEGQVREGLVRSMQDFGAFVDLGGVDGLLHVSQLGWHRVRHPSEVLTLGQRIKVLVRKIDPETKKISLSFRDLLENPWTQVAERYSAMSVVRGKVTRIMEFGAFVELEPGIEGMIHISELSAKRVFRIRDFINEGDEVEVKILNIDPQERRMSLSLKAAQALAAPAPKPEAETAEAETPAAPLPPKHKGPLKGGVERPSAGEKFGLKW
jgi:small subunit ribosomal protein S1